MLTEIVFVLDRSGSMTGMESDVIGGFNSFLSEQKKLKDKAKVTTVLFDTEYELLHDGVDIKDIKPITEKEYFTRGLTALHDAVGKAINTVKARAGKKDKVIFVINTDGQENSSHEYTGEQIKDLVKECEDKKNWKFIFLGVGVDGFALGSTIGMGATSFSTTKTGHAHQVMYTTISNVVTGYRGASSNTAALDTTPLEKDLE